MGLGVGARNQAHGVWGHHGRRGGDAAVPYVSHHERARARVANTRLTGEQAEAASDPR